MIIYFRKYILLFLFLLLVSLLIFYRTLGFDFIIDDWILLWDSRFHIESYGIYWSHPGTVIEFFLFYKIFGANSFVFNLFGIFLRALAGFVGYLFIAKLTRSQLAGYIFAVFFVTSYLGIQSTTWASAHIVYIDLILITFTSYAYLVYASSKIKRDFIIFLASFIVTILVDPGRNIIFIVFLLFSNILFFRKHQLHSREFKKFGIATVIVCSIFVFWNILFGYFFHNPFGNHHTRIPLETFSYYFGSLTNMIVDPLTRMFEFSINNPNSLLPIYLGVGIFLVLSWTFATILFIKNKSQSAYAFSLLLFWMLLFYIPSWFSYPRVYVPAIHRYLTISGFGLIAVFSLIICALYKRTKLLSIVLSLLIVGVNIATTQSHLQQEESFRARGIVGIWEKIDKKTPPKEKNSIFYFKGAEPLLTWGVVYSEGTPLRMIRRIYDPSEIIIVTNILEKIANQLCHRHIVSAEDFRQKEDKIPFHAWLVNDDGSIIDITKKERENLEKLFEKKDSCQIMKKTYGDTFTYFN